MSIFGQMEVRHTVCGVPIWLNSCFYRDYWTGITICWNNRRPKTLITSCPCKCEYWLSICISSKQIASETQSI